MAFILYQLLVAGSTLLAAIPVGCSVGYPGVLLQQLRMNDSSIQVDWDTASWIGSIHGLTGIPSILMPAFMQWRGRKLAFVLACLISIIGWIVAYSATTTTAILISESIHGFASQSIMAVGMLTMSEMLSPQIRSASMGLYLVMQTLGMALVGIIGSYVHWRTMSLIISAPLVLVTALTACMWPESPAWLAYKGDFEECAKAFTRLRGSDVLAKMELDELILAQKENLSRANNKRPQESLLQHFYVTAKSRDFYVPGIHMFVLLDTVYWTGSLVTIIYSSDIIQRTTYTKDALVFGSISLNSAMFIGCVTSIILIRFFKLKKVLLGSLFCTVVSLISASTFNYAQRESYMPLYILIMFMLFICICLPILFTISAELMPVKHRGLGGPLYVVCTCIVHWSSLKSAPYLFKYMNIWGTLLLYAANGILTGLFIWKCIPETKGRTLQQLEDYYAHGDIGKTRLARQVSNEFTPINK